MLQLHVTRQHHLDIFVKDLWSLCVCVCESCPPPTGLCVFELDSMLHPPPPTPLTTLPTTTTLCLGSCVPCDCGYSVCLPHPLCLCACVPVCVPQDAQARLERYPNLVEPTRLKGLTVRGGQQQQQQQQQQQRIASRGLLQAAA
jgi:hypothetical protein